MRESRQFFAEHLLNNRLQMRASSATRKAVTLTKQMKIGPCEQVRDVRVVHELELMDFTKWLDRSGGSQREVSDRHRIRLSECRVAMKIR